MTILISSSSLNLSKFTSYKDSVEKSSLALAFTKYFQSIANSSEDFPQNEFPDYFFPISNLLKEIICKINTRVNVPISLVGK